MQGGLLRLGRDLPSAADEAEHVMGRLAEWLRLLRLSVNFGNCVPECAVGSARTAHIGQRSRRH